jgi:uncharacterized protein
VLWFEEIRPLVLITCEGAYRLFHPQSLLLFDVPADTFNEARRFGQTLASRLPPAGVKLPDESAEDIFLTISLTTQCNLSCRYCYLHGQHRDWPCRDVKNGASDVLGVHREVTTLLESRPHKLGISFFGGEPLLARHTMIEITTMVKDMAVKAGIPVEFGITTNGFLLDCEFLEWTQNNNVKVMVSLDGPAELHNRYRAGGREECSFDSILSKLIGFETELTVVTTITQQTPSFREALEPLLDSGFRNVSFNLVHTRDPELLLREKDVKRFSSEWRNSSEWFHNHRHRIGNIFQLHRRLRDRTVKPYPCSAGHRSYAISLSGKQYFCHGCVGDSDCELDQSRRPLYAWLRQRWPQSSLLSECSDCWTRYLCGGECWLARWHLNNGERTLRCKLIRGIVELGIRTFDPSDWEVAPNE